VRGEVSSDGASPRSGVPVDVAMHALESLAGMGAGWSGSSRAPLRPGIVLVGSAESGTSI
jgi:hypothetical protein